MTTEELKQWIRNNIADRKRWATPLTRVDVHWINYLHQWLHNLEK